MPSDCCIESDVLDCATGEELVFPLYQASVGAGIPPLDTHWMVNGVSCIPIRAGRLEEMVTSLEMLGDEGVTILKDPDTGDACVNVVTIMV